MALRYLSLGVLALLVACGPTPRPRPPTRPPVVVGIQTCAAIWQEELHRPIDPDGLRDCMAQGLAGASDAQVRANVRRSPEWIARHAPPPVRPLTVKGRVSVSARTLRYPDGSLFRWRGATSFALLEQVAHGREAEAVAWMRTARAEGLTVVRVLTMATNLFRLSPAEGRAALPRLLTLANGADLYVHLVALADTGSESGMDYGAHVQAVGEACAASVACVLTEAANEPWHPSQASSVHDPANLRAWAARVPAGVPVALGAAESDESDVMAQGATVVTVHLDRSRDRWNRVRRVRELEAMSGRTNRYVIDSEPIGAADVAVSGKRDDDPAAFFGQGVLSRVFEAGSTFHSDAGLRSQPFSPTQLACLRAFVAGATLWPDGTTLRFSNAGWADSPIQSADWTRVTRAYSASDGVRWWTVLLGLTGDPGLRFVPGFSRGAALADRGAVQVIEAAR